MGISNLGKPLVSFSDDGSTLMLFESDKGYLWVWEHDNIEGDIPDRWWESLDDLVSIMYRLHVWNQRNEYSSPSIQMIDFIRTMAGENRWALAALEHL